jgi:hypothetical protein
MICQRPAALHVACADTYHAANGPRGNQPPTQYIDQHAYPTQAGQDLWATVLARVDTSSVTG